MDYIPLACILLPVSAFLAYCWVNRPLRRPGNKRRNWKLTRKERYNITDI